MFGVHLNTDLPSPILLLLVAVLLIPLLLLHHNFLPDPSSSSASPPSRPPRITTNRPANHRDTYASLRSRYGANVHLSPPSQPSTILIGDALTLKDVLDRPHLFPVGALHLASAPMWRISPAAAGWFADAGGQCTIDAGARLFSGSKLQLLQGRFVAALSAQLDSVREGTVDDVFALVSERVFESTMQALFTSTFPKGLYEVFQMWDGELQSFCAASPSTKAVAARDRLYTIVAEQLSDPLDQCSPQVRQLFEAVQHQHGQSRADAVAIVLRTAWLGATQTPMGAGWLMCILAQRPEKAREIRLEIAQLMAELGVDDVEELAKKPEWLKDLPLLDRLVKELLRVYCKQSVPRLCVEDTVVRAMDGNRVKKVQLKQGDLLQLLSWSVHDCGLYPQWWPETQARGKVFRGTTNVFDETRFEPDRHPSTVKLSGTNETIRTWMPFGCGPRICPGRYWAVAEIKAFVVLFLHRFELVEAGEMPRPDPARWVGVLSSLDGMPATIAARC